MAFSSNALLTVIAPTNNPPTNAPITLQSGLKGYWKLDETNSTRFDSTTNEFHLTPNNNVQFNPNGKLNGAASFNAFQGNQGLYVANTNARAPLAFTGDWAVSSWVNHGAMRYDADNIFSKRNEIYFFVQRYSVTNRYHVRLYSGGSTPTVLLDHAFGYVVPTNVWQHTILQRSGNSVQLYVNGELKGNVSISGTIQDGGGSFWVGMDQNGWPWNGSIDEVGYWGRSLDASEIAALYGNGTPPSYETFNPPVVAAPAITQQPVAQTVDVGTTATFTVEAAGGEPLNYQWLFDGEAIIGATSPVLELSNVTTNQAGYYSVTITNSAGSVTSSNALLTVILPVDHPIALQSGLKGYWKLDETNSTRFDSTTNQFHLTPYNNVQFNPNGKLNGAALFNAFHGDQGFYVANTNGRAPLAFTGDWSVSSWVSHGAMRYDADHIFHKPGEIHFFVQNYNVSPRLHVRILNGSTVLLNHAFGYIMPTNAWRHVVLQRSGNVIELYVNGALEGTVAFTGAIENKGGNFWVGMEQNGWPWNGSIDEVGYWGRSLNTAEIAALYGSGTPPTYESFNPTIPAPTITHQPASQTVHVGGIATFTVEATGNEPLSYQWLHEGESIAGATTAVLELTDVTATQAGHYWVIVSNNEGAVTSSNALLTVIPPVNYSIALRSGLKGYWKMDETNSTRFDSTTNQFHLTPYNNVQFNPEGKLNGAAVINSFQGDQGLYVANTNARAPLAFTGDWAVSSWVNHGAMRYDAAHVFNKWGEIHFYVDNYTGPHRLHLLMLSGTANPTILLNHQFAYVMPTNVWRHLLLQRTGNSIELYVDGQFEESVAFTNNVQNGGWDFWVGMEKNGWPWNGSIDEVGYWGRSLNAGEIATLYSHGAPPSFETFNNGPEAPFITEQPISQTVSRGANVTFSVEVGGSSPLSYQWFFKKSLIAGATDSSFTRTAARPNHAGQYFVVITNAFGAVTSEVAVLTVANNGRNTFQPASSYHGLFFESDAVRHESSGYFTMKMRNAAFSGKMLLDGDAISFSGEFDADGAVQHSVSRAKFGKTPVELNLQLDFATEQMTGTISSGDWTANLVADEATFDQANPAVDFHGKYTVLIPGADDVSAAPIGYGYGLVTVGTNGRISLNGKLADRQVAKQGTFVSKNGDWPFFVQLYVSNPSVVGGANSVETKQAKGSLLGWLSLSNGPSESLQGNVSWIKKDGMGDLYPHGFSHEAKVIGSIFTPSVGATRLLNITNETAAFYGGNLPQKVAHSFKLYEDNRCVPVAETNLNISVSTSSGLLKGLFRHPVSDDLVPFYGAVLQEQKFGGGFFLGIDEPGLMRLEQE